MTVGGMVSNPGTIALRNGVTTLSDAVSAVGGAIRPTVVSQETAQDSPLTTMLEDLSILTTETTRAGKAKLEIEGVDAARESEAIAQLENLAKDVEETRRKVEHYVSVRFSGEPDVISQLFKKVRALQDVNYSLQGIQVQEGVDHEVTVDELEKTSQELLAELTRARREIPVSVSSTTSSSIIDTKEASGKSLLVQLKRAAEGSVLNYYFPLTYVESGDAGNISLIDGDVIFVKSQTQTVLASAPSTSGNAIALTGFVKQEAIYPQGGIATLGAVENVIHPRVNPARVVLVVERATSAGKDVFVLPYQSVTDRDAFGSVSTHPNDHIRVVPSFQAPLVSDLAASRAAGQELAAQVDSIVANRPILNHEEEKHIRMQKSFRSASTKVRRFIRP